MNLNQFINQLNSEPEKITFADTMAIVDALYQFTPTAFQNGDQNNEANQNNGSCKLFAFARLHELDEQQALNCFGEFYRDVLATPEADDHQNIRNFMQTGWSGIQFDAMPLSSLENVEVNNG